MSATDWYCDVEDVKARAGRLKEAWGDSTPVSDGDLERFIRDSSNAVNIALASRGFDVPAVNVNVTGSLVPVVADMALLMALEATWPGGKGGAESVKALYDAVLLRVQGSDGKGGYLGGLMNGTLAAFVFLHGTTHAESSGASSFWSTEVGYSSWLDDLQSGQTILDDRGHVVFRSPLGPLVHRDTKF